MTAIRYQKSCVMLRFRAGKLPSKPYAIEATAARSKLMELRSFFLGRQARRMPGNRTQHTPVICDRIAHPPQGNCGSQTSRMHDIWERIGHQFLDVPLDEKTHLADITYPLDGFYGFCFWKHLTDSALSTTFTCSDWKSSDSAKKPITSKT